MSDHVSKPVSDHAVRRSATSRGCPMSDRVSEPAEQRCRPPLGKWPHRLAVVLACATFPLIWIGGLVTTTDSGMAVPDWPTTFGYNPFLYPWQTWFYGPWNIFIEHGHRLAASVVGLLTLVFAGSVWYGDRRRWVRWFALVAVLLVIAQGVLGGMRVVLDQGLLAMIHGVMGPTFFALCVALACWTSPAWRNRWTLQPLAMGKGLVGMAALMCLLTYLQIVLGAAVRHMPVAARPEIFRAAVYFHLAGAAAVSLQSIALWIHCRGIHACSRALRAASHGLIALLAVQLLLGAAAWIVKFGWPAWAVSFPGATGYTVQAGSVQQTYFVTAHVAVGSLLLALTVWMLLEAV